jgi:hypothetical protein
VYEDDMWAIKGPYTVAVTDKDDLEWTAQSNTLVLRLLIVSFIYLFIWDGHKLILVFDRLMWNRL